MPRRRYTNGQRAEAVAAATLSSVEAAAQKTGIPRTTIDYWLDKPEFVELRSKTRDHVADQMWAAIQVGVQEVAKGLVSDAPLRDKSVALGILYDKHALLTGGATGRTESRDITGSLADSDIVAAIQSAEALVGAGEGRTPAPTEDPPAG